MPSYFDQSKKGRLKRVTRRVVVNRLQKDHREMNMIFHKFPNSDLYYSLGIPDWDHPEVSHVFWIHPEELEYFAGEVGVMCPWEYMD